MDENLKKPLVEKIVNSCIDQLKYFDKDITLHKISSYIFLTSDVYQDIGVCYCDESDLIDYAKVIDLNSWTKLGYHSESFIEVNNYIDELFDVFYEGELEADPLEEFTSDQLY